MRAALNNSIEGILTLEKGIKQSQVLIWRAKTTRETTSKQLGQQQRVNGDEWAEQASAV
jgi:hypothetical protein